MDGVRVRLLGPVQVESDGVHHRLRPPQLATIVAVLAAGAGSVVSTESLIDRVWGDSPPSGSRRTLQTHIAKLRRLIDIEHCSGGYALDIDPDLVDLHRFRRLSLQDDGDPAARERALGEAVALWLGEPLTGLGGDWARHARQLWRLERHDTVIRWARLLVVLEQPDRAVNLLLALTDEHPLSEAAAAALIEALRAAGRKAEALERYARVRSILASELGTEPGAQLQQAHRSLLREGYPRLAVLPTPAQLPLDLRAFTGRSVEMAVLDGLLRDDRHASVCAISGAPGIGKTALAVRWAHLVAQRFPDGQLYVNLRGADVDDLMVTPAEALCGLLEALGVTSGHMPSTLEARTGLYRSLLAGRKALVLLDNARDTDQVRPLLAGAPGCLTVVTSRNRLTGLQVGEGAQAVALGALAPAEAMQLLAARLGTARLRGETEAAQQLVSRCAGLPLALAMVAAKAAAYPELPLSRLGEQLWQTHPEPGLDLRTVFARSLRDLSAPAACMFRLIGRHPGPELSVAAAASLAAVPVTGAQAAIAELVHSHLLEEVRPGRYWPHDLLHAYASELAAGEARAEDRLLAYYRYNAYRASLLCFPNPVAITMAAPAEPVVVEEFADPDAAMDWLATERSTLLATIARATAIGMHSHVWQTAWAVNEYLQRRGHWLEMKQVQHAAVEAARRVGDREAQARSHNNLARAYHRAGRVDAAIDNFRQALSLLESGGNYALLAHAHNGLSSMLSRLVPPHLAEALKHAQLALEIFRRLGDEPGQARALNNVGWMHAMLGDPRQSLEKCREAQAILARVGHTIGEAHAWDSVGHAHHLLAEFEPAIVAYERALALFRREQHLPEQAGTLERLGDSQQALGDTGGAQRSWRLSLSILDQLGDAQAESVRLKVLRP